jgi:hypothetical protein
VSAAETELFRTFAGFERIFGMPRFFFHLRSPGKYSKDDVGSDFLDVEHAYLDAHQCALEMSFEMLRDHQDPHHFQFDITDEEGGLLLDLPFSEVLRPGARHMRHNSILAELRKNIQRAKVLQSEIRGEFARTQVALQTARETIKKSRMPLRG